MHRQHRAVRPLRKGNIFCYANSQNITKTKTKSFGEIAHLLTAVQLVIKLLSSGVKYVDRIYIYKGMKRK